MAHRAGALIVIAYRKFSDTLQNEVRGSTLPKPAKAPKADPIEPPQARALGGLGALGDALVSIAVHKRGECARAIHSIAPSGGFSGKIARSTSSAIARHSRQVPSA
jgi:hypothetical protein